MDGLHQWKQLKIWQNLLRILEEDKRMRMIDRLERLISDKQSEFEKRKKKISDADQKEMQDIENRERRIREKQKELKIKSITDFDMDNIN